ncbi:hypothetical protein [Roseibium sediminis]|uniref:hypothetical protein n=1 Tax=Roseibium sediminis TaxID=1775174 RepID=UPI00123DAE65|nr:hypothetical protein [Roseibium sediminis]
MNFIWAIAMLVASYAIQLLLAPKQKAPDAATFEDFDFPQFEEGTPEAVYFGDCNAPDFFVVWYGNFRTSPIKVKGGGKK